MFAFLKAVGIGIFLAFLLSLFIGSGGSSGGMLNVRSVTFEGYQFYWSWARFLLGTALSFGIMLLRD